MPRYRYERNSVRTPNTTHKYMIEKLSSVHEQLSRDWNYPIVGLLLVAGVAAVVSGAAVGLLLFVLYFPEAVAIPIAAVAAGLAVLVSMYALKRVGL